MAGTVDSAALGSHFGASLKDHGPNVVLHRAGPQTARRAESLRGHDHSRQSSSSPKPLHRPTANGAPLIARAGQSTFALLRPTMLIVTAAAQHQRRLPGELHLARRAERLSLLRITQPIPVKYQPPHRFRSRLRAYCPILCRAHASHCSCISATTWMFWRHFRWPHGRLIMLKLFMDESGNGNATQPLIVGAVELGEDADEIEKRIRDLHRDLCARRSLAGLPSFEKFRENGFHSSTDPLEVSGPFTELMRKIFFRTYMVTTDRKSFPNVEESKLIEFMYVKLLSDLSIRHGREAELLCYIEQSEEMKSILSRLPDSVTRQARKTAGQSVSLPRLNTTMVGKRDYMSTAIIDYVMAAVSRWLKADLSLIHI